MNTAAETDNQTTTEATVLTFALGLPGFPDVHRFTISELSPDSPFSVMRCIDVQLEFVVTTPSIFFPDYAPEIDDAVVARLGITKPEEALILIIVNVGKNLAETTANLLGPIVVNVNSWDAAQAVLAHGDWSVKTPLGLK